MHVFQCSSTSLSNFELCIANHRFLALADWPSQLVFFVEMYGLILLKPRLNPDVVCSCCISRAIICCMGLGCKVEVDWLLKVALSSQSNLSWMLLLPGYSQGKQAYEQAVADSFESFDGWLHDTISNPLMHCTFTKYTRTDLCENLSPTLANWLVRLIFSPEIWFNTWK